MGPPVGGRAHVTVHEPRWVTVRGRRRGRIFWEPFPGTVPALDAGDGVEKNRGREGGEGVGVTVQTHAHTIHTSGYGAYSTRSCFTLEEVCYHDMYSSIVCAIKELRIFRGGLIVQRFVFMTKGICAYVVFFFCGDFLSWAFAAPWLRLRCTGICLL